MYIQGTDQTFNQFIKHDDRGEPVARLIVGEGLNMFTISELKEIIVKMGGELNDETEQASTGNGSTGPRKSSGTGSKSKQVSKPKATGAAKD